MCQMGNILALGQNETQHDAWLVVILKTHQCIRGNPQPREMFLWPNTAAFPWICDEQGGCICRPPQDILPYKNAIHPECHKTAPIPGNGRPIGEIFSTSGNAEPTPQRAPQHQVPVDVGSKATESLFSRQNGTFTTYGPCTLGPRKGDKAFCRLLFVRSLSHPSPDGTNVHGSLFPSPLDLCRKQKLAMRK